MDRKQSSGVQAGNFDLGKCVCQVKCKHGHETRLINIGRAHFVACDTRRTCIWVGSNLISGWRVESEAVWRQDRKSIRRCRRLEW